MPSIVRGAVAPVLLLLCSTPLLAQTYEDVGTRAKGMAGAFVSVVDDASATWWNPAGLASGALASGLYEYGQVTEPRDLAAFSPARRATVSGVATAFPAAGVSIYRLRISEISAVPSTTGSGAATRQDLGGAAPVRSLGLTQLGLTVGQSVGGYLVIGSTVKLLHGGVSFGLPPAGSDLLDAADDLPIEREWHTDLDIGALAKLGGAKFGVSIRNLTEPTFGGAEAMTVKRQARAGASWTSGVHGAVSAFTLSGDTDLTTAETSLGDVRHFALGTEIWVSKRRVGVRGGWSKNTAEGGAHTLSTGTSVGVTRNFFLEAAYASGSDRTLRGWSGSARFAY